MATLMTGFPPAPEDQVSLANWGEAPFNRWSYRHVREIIPTADIARDPQQAKPLPVGLVDTGKIRIRGVKGPRSVARRFSHCGTHGQPGHPPSRTHHR